jgi:hypothetical protein
MLGSTMEGLLAEVGSRFVPWPLEELLAVATVLLHTYEENACLLDVCGP